MGKLNVTLGGLMMKQNAYSFMFEYVLTVYPRYMPSNPDLNSLFLYNIPLHSNQLTSC